MLRRRETVALSLGLALILGGCSESLAGGAGARRDDLDFANSGAGNGNGSGGGGDGSAGDGSGGDGSGGDGSAGNGSAGNGSAGSVSGGGVLDGDVCRLVDVIISVDGSGSMTEELRAMRDDVFPAFADRLQTIAGGLDNFRVGTIDACPEPANLHTRGSGGECNFAGGNVWMESSSPNLRDEFSCVGDIFQNDISCDGNNDDEQPASAAATALEREFGSGANQGFSRANSLLVVVAITDEDEQPTTSARSAQQVHDRLVAAKGGDPGRIVFLGIAGSQACNGAYGQASRGRLMQDITQEFARDDRGVFWDLCDGRLEDGLDEAFSVIERACNDLPPPPDMPPPYSEGPD